MSVLGILASAQALAEYGGATSSGGLSALSNRLGNFASTAANELGRLVGFAMAHPAPTMLLLALIAVAVIVRSTYLR